VKQLILLRHAAAEQGRPGLADIERPLSERGRTEALHAAEQIVVAGLRIDALMASPARRSRETAIIVAAQLDLARPIHYDPPLYLGEPDVLLQSLQHCRSSAHTVLLVGHNPGLSELAQRFTGRSEPVELRTAGLCHIAFELDSWQQLRPRAASAFSIMR
jgi:phosphohistidine phosphatase